MLVASVVVARYLILVTAGLLQLAVALAIGMPWPPHPFDLWIVFTFVSFAFIGLGLVMAMMADNVPAVQALGQCIFLPMLIIGGIAVPLASLPDWAQHLSQFFPGRYAVEALQACIVGPGLSATGFELLALLIIGTGGAVAGAKMFRWDAQQRFARRSGKAWISVALISWVVVGTLAEYRARAGAEARNNSQNVQMNLPTPPVESTTPTPSPEASSPSTSPIPSDVTLSAAERKAAASHTPATKPSTTAETKPSTPEAKPSTPASSTPSTAKPSAPAARAEQPPAAAAPPHPAAKSWQAVTLADIDRDLVFDRLPSDQGIVTPIAPADEEPDPDTSDHLQDIREMLPSWQPGKVADPVQRVRNILYVAAVPDVLQTPIERFAPYVVFERLQQDVPKDQLIKVLYWIALHPTDGDDSAIKDLWALKFSNDSVDPEQTRERAAIYSVKLLGRLLGKLPGGPS